MAFGGKLVIRVYLNRERILCVERLDKQREINAIAFEVLLANQVTHIDLDQLFDIIPFEHSIGDNREVATQTRQIPAFAVLAATVNTQPLAFLGNERRTSPNARFQTRAES